MKKKRVLTLMQSALLALTAVCGQPFPSLSARAADDRDAPVLTECELRITPDTGPVTPVQPSRSKKLMKKSSAGGDRPQITLQGLLPEDISAEAVTVDPEQYIQPTDDAVLYAYDISLYSAQSFYEPDGEQISVTVSGKAIAAAEEAGTPLTVVHLPDDPTAPVTYITDAEIADGALTFRTDSFSVYLIKEGEDGVICRDRNVYHYLTGATDSSGRILNDPYEYQAVNESGFVRNTSCQIVKDGDTLQAVPLPNAQDGKSFFGWYIVGVSEGGEASSPFTWPDAADIEDARVQFGEPVTVEQDNVHYYLAPLFREYRIVVFHEWLDGVDMTYSRKMAVLGTSAESGKRARVRIDDVTAPDHGSNMFFGWKLETGTSNNALPREYITRDGLGNYSETYFEFSEDDFPLTWDGALYIHLIPMFREGHWLNFNTMDSDATYFAPAYVENTTPVTSEMLRTRIPVWVGYTFEGWYLDEECSSDQLTDASGNLVGTYAGGFTLSQNRTVYAKWTATDVSAQYRYLYWVQLATDSVGDIGDESKKHYSFLRSQTETGLAGPSHKTPDPPVFTAADEENGITDSGFTVRSDPQQVIKPDGTTVVNVYYDRKERQIEFQTYGSGYIYTETTGVTGTQYGLVDGEYVQLTRDSGTNVYVYTLPYSYSRATAGSGGFFQGTSTYYYIDSNHLYQSISLYQNDGRFYQNRNFWGGYENEYTDPVYNRTTVNSVYTGTRYLRNGSTYTETTGDSGTQYALDSNGGYIPLTRSSSTVYRWYYNNGADEYTGTRYTRSTGNGWHTLKTIRGLYGQTFEQAGVTWPAGYDWYEEKSGSSTSGTHVTFLDGFTDSAKSIYYGKTASGGSSRIRFYKQGLSENEWILANEIASGGGTFTFTEKYQGFHLLSYSTDGGSTWRTASVNGRVSYSSTLDIRFSRDKYSLIFMDGRDNPSTPYKEYTQIPFGTDLSAYAFEPYPPNDEDYTYIGWSPDLTGVSMPAHNVVVYAERETPVYQVVLDPNGGAFRESYYQGVDINDPTWTNKYSTFFKLRYPNYKIEEYPLEYVYTPAESESQGNYVYILVEPDENYNPPIDPDTGRELHRFARYVHKGSAEAAQYADYLKKDEHGNVQYYREMNNADGRNTLVGWYQIDPQTGARAARPFNFQSDVKPEDGELIILQAVWSNTGAQFSVTYEAVYEADGLQISGQMVDSNATALAENAVITVAGKPEPILSNDGNEYVFEYWDVSGIQAMPGDQLRVTREIADTNLNVRIRAVYALKEESSHNQQLVHLRLHANYVAADATVEETYMGSELQNMQQNHRVDLAPYETTFTRAHYRLIGWSTKPDPDDPDAVIFAVNAQVGVYLDQPGVPHDAESFTNHLYAVWEQDPPAPTGVQRDTAPYLFMVMIAVLLGTAVIFRRKEGMRDDSPPL